MKALAYHGKEDVRVDNVPDPMIEAPDDIILRVTATAICGSDLHLYRGKMPQTKDGDILGHEFMGIVEEVGPEVTAVKKGDRVVVPFVIACGECFFCAMDLHAACENTNTGRGAILNKKQIPPGAALFGYSHLYGGVPGGQAELVRVPRANAGPFKVPDVRSVSKPKAAPPRPCSIRSRSNPAAVKRCASASPRCGVAARSAFQACTPASCTAF